ncbi:hypothetical protein G9A89_023968 [Geosiphon pyriformis]|nr:hypothetical protein G9A89_023968 [Geosiphon pyriformis]
MHELNYFIRDHKKSEFSLGNGISGLLSLLEKGYKLNEEIQQSPEFNSSLTRRLSTHLQPISQPSSPHCVGRISSFDGEDFDSITGYGRMTAQSSLMMLWGSLPRKNPGRS